MSSREAVRLFLCGDVMTGRGIDQILPHPLPPHLHESYVRSARQYVYLAELENGPIPEQRDFAYIWGDALDELYRVHPDLRIVNLETAVTTSEDAWPRKGIHYRMNPLNVPCLTAAGFDCCILANNHTLDCGYAGLEQSLHTLHGAGVRTAGAGLNIDEASAPAQLPLPDGRRVLVFAYGTLDSGIPPEWAATETRPGVQVLTDLSAAACDQIASDIRQYKHAGEIVIVALHWGGNWGYEVPDEHRAFAHRLIETAGVDIIFGHSSHHPKGIEVHRGKLILYGCGDFINDYEGIGGYERYRPYLGLMYFATVSGATGDLIRLEMTPTCVRQLSVNLARHDDARWLSEVLSRESRQFDTTLDLLPDDTLALRWRDSEHVAGSRVAS
ncbi:MAG TPA: CapA family protein [Steroidobacteraceae bacterium]